MAKRLENLFLPREDGCFDVPLTYGFVTAVDAVSIDKMRPFCWCARRDRDRDTWYVVTNIPSLTTKSKRTTITLQRFLLNPAPGLISDHRDGDPMNNRLSNLREADYSQSKFNQREGPFGEVKLLQNYKWKNPWYAGVKRGGRNITKQFSTREEAAVWRKEMELKIYADFPREHQG